MTVTWERFAGTTDVFAVRLSFSPDPDDELVAGADEARSWGALEMWVHGQNLCTHVDQGEVLQRVHWYLLPLLEWLVDSWNPLLHEERLPNRNAADSGVSSLAATRAAPELIGEVETFAWEQEWFEWNHRHSIRAARAGGLFPNVVFRRLRDQVQISWAEERQAGAPSGFQFSATAGSALLRPEEVARPLYEVISAATRHLRDLAPDSTRLAAVSEKLESLTDSAQHDVRVRWLSGLADMGPPSGQPPRRTADPDLVSTWERVVRALATGGRKEAVAAALATEDRPLVVAGSCQAALLFGAVSPQVSESDVQTLAEVLVSQFTPAEVESAGLRALTASEPLNSVSPPWEQGYDLAESLHDDLGLPGEWVDIEDFVRRLEIGRLDRDLDDAAIRGCSIVGPQHSPTIVVNRRSPYSASPVAVRFSLAHELCHILYDRALGRRLAIASGPWAPRGIERRANAFAAMFLMPPRLIEAAVADASDPITDPNGIRGIATRLRVSNRAAVEHLYNLTLMSEDQRDQLLRALDPGSRGA